MAEVMCKSGVFSSPICSNDSHRGKGQIFPVRCSVSTVNRARFVGPLRSDFGGLRLDVDLKLSTKKKNPQSICAKMGLSIGKAQRWWEKGLQPNMKEITSAEDLVGSLLNAGDKLVVVDFFSPGCGGCKALHPKICQLAEMNPDVQFLQINYEEHKSMCYSLNVHVLPFFRFYRGAEGRVCSFSCTNATIKKFKDALAKYGTDRCTIGPPKGLEEKELLALAANKDLSFTYTPKPTPVEVGPMSAHRGAHSEAEAAAAAAAEGSSSPTKTRVSSSPARSSQDSVEKSLVSAGR